MFRNILILLFVFMFWIPVIGQDTVIEYGQTVEGEITNSQFELTYAFSGTEGDVIVIEMLPVDTLGDLDNPELLLLDSDNQIVTSTAGSFSFGSATLIAELPHDGRFTIIATRRDGRSGASVGEFTLELMLPEVINLAKSANGTVSSEGESQYYVVKPEKEFIVSYQKTDGDMFPEITIGTVNPETGGLVEAAVASGKALTEASFGVFAGGMPYLIVISKAPFDFNFNEVTADYILIITPST